MGRLWIIKVNAVAEGGICRHPFFNKLLQFSNQEALQVGSDSGLVYVVPLFVGFKESECYQFEWALLPFCFGVVKITIKGQCIQ